MSLTFSYHCLRRDISNFSLLKHRDFIGMLITMHQSGTHWLKFILTSAISHQKGMEMPKLIQDEHQFFGNPKSHIPRPGIPAMASAHSIPHLLVGSPLMHQIMPFPRYVVLVRDIPASLVSNYEKWKDKREGVEFSEFLRGDVAGKRFDSDIWWCIRFFNAWGRVLENLPEGSMLMRYEDMQQDVESEIARVVEFLGLELSAESIQAGIANSSKKKMAKQHDPELGIPVVREDDRPVEDWFNPQDQAYLSETLRKYLKYDLGYTY